MPMLRRGRNDICEVYELALRGPGEDHTNEGGDFTNTRAVRSGIGPIQLRWRPFVVITRIVPGDDVNLIDLAGFELESPRLGLTWLQVDDLEDDELLIV